MRNMFAFTLAVLILSPALVFAAPSAAAEKAMQPNSEAGAMATEAASAPTAEPMGAPSDEHSKTDKDAKKQHQKSEKHSKHGKHHKNHHHKKH